MHIHFGSIPLAACAKALDECVQPRPIPFKIGARVRINTPDVRYREPAPYHGRYDGCVGEIVRMPDIAASLSDEIDLDKITIGVRIDNQLNERSQYGCFWFKIKELTVITEEKENTNMLLLKGYKVTKVYVDGHGPQYTASYESELAVGEKVVVTNGENYCVGEVSCVEYPPEVSHAITPKFQIVCKIDEAPYQERTERAKRARQLEKELKEAIQDYQQIALFEMMAEKSPAIAELLKEYKEVAGC